MKLLFFYCKFLDKVSRVSARLLNKNKIVTYTELFKNGPVIFYYSLVAAE